MLRARSRSLIAAYPPDMLDSWDLEGEIEMTEYWRSIVPDISLCGAEDLTGLANARQRVESIRQRYALELKHVARRGSIGATSRVTRISD